MFESSAMTKRQLSKIIDTKNTNNQSNKTILNPCLKSQRTSILKKSTTKEDNALKIQLHDKHARKIAHQIRKEETKKLKNQVAYHISNIDNTEYKPERLNEIGIKSNGGISPIRTKKNSPTRKSKFLKLRNGNFRIGINDTETLTPFHYTQDRQNDCSFDNFNIQKDIDSWECNKLAKKKVTLGSVIDQHPKPIMPDSDSMAKSAITKIEPNKTTSAKVECEKIAAMIDIVNSAFCTKTDRMHRRNHSMACQKKTHPNDLIPSETVKPDESIKNLPKSGLAALFQKEKNTDKPESAKQKNFKKMSASDIRRNDFVATDRQRTLELTKELMNEHVINQSLKSMRKNNFLMKGQHTFSPSQSLMVKNDQTHDQDINTNNDNDYDRFFDNRDLGFNMDDIEQDTQYQDDATNRVNGTVVLNYKEVRKQFPKLFEPNERVWKERVKEILAKEHYESGFDYGENKISKETILNTAIDSYTQIKKKQEIIGQRNSESNKNQYRVNHELDNLDRHIQALLKTKRKHLLSKAIPEQEVKRAETHTDQASQVKTGLMSYLVNKVFATQKPVKSYNQVYSNFLNQKTGSGMKSTKFMDLNSIEEIEETYSPTKAKDGFASTLESQAGHEQRVVNYKQNNHLLIQAETKGYQDTLQTQTEEISHEESLMDNFMIEKRQEIFDTIYNMMNSDQVYIDKNGMVNLFVLLNKFDANIDKSKIPGILDNACVNFLIQYSKLLLQEIIAQNKWKAVDDKKLKKANNQRDRKLVIGNTEGGNGSQSPIKIVNFLNPNNTARSNNTSSFKMQSNTNDPVGYIKERVNTSIAKIRESIRKPQLQYTKNHSKFFARQGRDVQDLKGHEVNVEDIGGFKNIVGHLLKPDRKGRYMELLVQLDKEKVSFFVIKIRM